MKPSIRFRIVLVAAAALLPSGLQAQTWFQGDPQPRSSCVDALASIGRIDRENRRRKMELARTTAILDEARRLPMGNEIYLVCPYPSLRETAVAVRIPGRPIELSIGTGATLTRDDLTSLHELGMSSIFETPRRELRSRMGLDRYPELDSATKDVFLLDGGGFGVMPGVLGMPRRTIVVASESIARARENSELIKNRPFIQEEAVLVCGFPVTDAQHKLIFPKRPPKDVREWKSARDQLDKIASGNIGEFADVNVITAARDLLARIEEARDVVMLAAHADATGTIDIPSRDGKSSIRIGPDDIRTLDLSRRPFVILRICNGDQFGWAQAFIEAGAVGVWMNGGEVAPAACVEEIERFLDLARRLPIGQAIDEILKNPRSYLRTGVFAISPDALKDVPRG